MFVTALLPVRLKTAAGGLHCQICSVHHQAAILVTGIFHRWVLKKDFANLFSNGFESSLDDRCNATAAPFSIAIVHCSMVVGVAS